MSVPDYEWRVDDFVLWHWGMLTLLPSEDPDCSRILLQEVRMKTEMAFPPWPAAPLRHLIKLASFA
jgi:hypothetical protein